MEPLFDALPHNTHLRVLDCTEVGVSRTLAAQRLLTAVRANTSLRCLSWGQSTENNPEREEVSPEAIALVAARGKAANGE
jgi:hypothetical protein